ncbi:DUF58 domain-containing protein [Cryobacterium zhongshanensis]|uniref:DUF58 domain-containing protein n=1 Tax=Cryobacterium zhongshanensis TaxID=2928153 RepID=A0AA41QUY5_9MICO|nr:DUF58 domain-containing protein [Cryobacterium zhongshanensis]MCI4658187.1 DUF58 domain-containing protein [Cryobacterium zhongshanensis]
MSTAGALWSAPSRIAGRATRGGKDALQRARASLAPLGELWVRVVWPVIAPAYRAAGRMLAVATGFGWGLVVATVLSWILGQVFGWHEFTAIAAVGLAVLVLAVPFVLGRSAYTVELGLAKSRVVVGELAVGSVEVRNASTRALLPARIELPVGRGLASFHLPRLAVGTSHEDLFTIPTQRRTVLSVGPVRSVRGDALGLFRRTVDWNDAVDLFVHPRTVRLDGSSSGFLRDLEGMPTKDLSNDDVSFHALREYVPGDDRRNVHWRSTARTGRIMVRQFEETRRSHLAIALSRNPGDYADAEEFELAVSVCGSLGLQALKEDKQITVLAQDQTVPAATGKRLLDGLAGIEQRDSRADIVQLARHTGNAVPNASVVILLFGSVVEATRIRSAASHVPRGVRVIAVNCHSGAVLSRRSIATTTVLTVGDLTELPIGMSRVSE